MVQDEANEFEPKQKDIKQQINWWNELKSWKTSYEQHRNWRL